MARLYLVLPACDDNFPAALAKLLYLGGLHSSHLCIAVLANSGMLSIFLSMHDLPKAGNAPLWSWRSRLPRGAPIRWAREGKSATHFVFQCAPVARESCSLRRPY